MRLLIDLAIAILIAAVVGFGSAVIVLDRDRLFGAVTRGEWTAWPDSGSANADPYTEAMLARSGEVPLGSGEGLAFTAEADRNGARLSGRCSYRIVGQTPAARLWTLTAYDGDGHLMENPANRTGFHSREILRREDGSFVIQVSPHVEPGNWLPVETDRALRLVLRIYDTPLTSGGVGDAILPSIERVSCS
ncbi:DUF1214 domain-containing protein [Kaistia dalseonensis]|uniref:DUF1214 domain-containing protein n=1 Tax=Kaistia dalseonensis TaxID=410840 RepID=A0ABU0HDA5_9HYPH|nr:DUF1214 domain-containing protein [Kaistia dalseonensis]MCX5497623.1 DUF1214 domain-containing protein [Kaistia dalseonensis]MDQ0440265.1 hypothetical protein [Kaistia dalseonensis]